MPGVASVALGSAKLTTALAQLDNLNRRLVANLVAAAATLFAPCHGHGLPVDRGHRFHGGPRYRMLAFTELLHLRLMAGGARVGRGDLHLGDIASRAMLVAMAGNTGHVN